MYKKDGIMKMSPNIVQIRHREGLTKKILDELFAGLIFHKIVPPLTAKGAWKLYVANRVDYLKLLSQPYMLGSKLLQIFPYYESSLRLPLERGISESQIYLYSRSEALSTPKQIQEAIPDLINFPIYKCKYEDENLFIFHIYKSSKFLKVLNLNGSPLSKAQIY
ncbi:hypothetical protein RF11_08640 [Thelohanellus kitauei]|uniref:Uncharacterized protein n=1 Tax=Thelohanellus kitauei TaxID=669202 RepID=A0A0C2MY31_THEKT|nr:hypothetical protein RF11_08640 [Thelohanellus kitauei]